MPGVAQLSVDNLVEEARTAYNAGVRSLILFGIPDRKDAEGTSAWDANGPVCTGFKALKDALPDMVLVADVCMCEYTDHGTAGRSSATRAGTWQSRTIARCHCWPAPPSPMRGRGRTSSLPAT